MKPSATDIRNYRLTHRLSMYEAMDILWKENIRNAIKERQDALMVEEVCHSVEEIMLELLEMIDAK